MHIPVEIIKEQSPTRLFPGQEERHARLLIELGEMDKSPATTFHVYVRTKESGGRLVYVFVTTRCSESAYLLLGRMSPDWQEDLARFVSCAFEQLVSNQLILHIPAHDTTWLITKTVELDPKQQGHDLSVFTVLDAR